LVQQVEPTFYARADTTRFKQILMNLVGNAIKFTPETGRSNWSRVGWGDKSGWKCVTWPGIALEEQQRIFEAFFRLTQTGNTTEGTGLGLAITARLVELHGSKLEIESKPGKGTCFHFSLPLLAMAPDEPARTTIAVSRAGKTPLILIVEDNAATGQLIQSQLTSSVMRLCDVISRNAPRKWRLNTTRIHHFGPSYAAGPRAGGSVAIEK